MPLSSAANPYVAGPPLGKQAGFFGREDILEAVEQTLRQPTNNSVILYGQRKIGKTSLLLQLEHRLPSPPFFTIYLNLVGKTLLPLSQVLYQLAATAAQKASIPAPSPAEFDEDPAIFHQTFLPSLYRALGPQRQPVFLLDEFDLVSTPEQELPQSAAVRTLDDYLYMLLTTQNYADFVFAAGRRMDELSAVVSASFQANLVRFVSVLPPADAQALLRQPGSPIFDDDAVERVLALTRGHPLLTQVLGWELFNLAYKRAPEEPRISMNEVDGVVPNVLAASDNGLLEIWDSLPPAERLTLAAIAAQLGPTRAPLSASAIAAVLREAGLDPDTADLPQAPANLVKWQMLELGDDGYSFFIPLIQRWVARQCPLEQVKKDELVRLSPQAQLSYEAARRSHHANQTQQALTELNQALALNSNHVPARLLLGQIQQDQNQLTAAVDTFEAADRLDRLAAGPLLISALLSLGAAREKAGDQPGALAAYNRVLAISPQEKTALSRRNTLINIPTGRPRTRRLWPVALAALLLLALLLVCLWAFLPGGISNQAATATAAAQIASTQLAATTNAMTASATEDAATASAAMALTATAGANASATASAPLPATPAPPEPTIPPPTPTEPPANQIAVAGPPDLQPMAAALAAAFTTRNPEAQLQFQPGGPDSGLEAIRQGAAQVGAITRDLSPTELAELGDVQLINLPQLTIVAVVAHPLVGVENLSVAQLREIFSGNITNWSSLGGADRPIVPVALIPGTRARTTFEQKIMGPASPIPAGLAIEELSNRDARDTVASRPYAIGFVELDSVAFSPDSFPDLASGWTAADTDLLEVSPIAIDQVPPSRDNAASGAYPLTSPLHLIIRNPPSELVSRWIEFVRSPEGLEIIQNTTGAAR